LTGWARSQAKRPTRVRSIGVAMGLLRYTKNSPVVDDVDNQGGVIDLDIPTTAIRAFVTYLTQ
jgi:hypothetical protein